MTPNSSMIRIPLAAALLFLFSLEAGAAGSAVVKAEGQVDIVRQGKKIPAEPGTPIQPGDTVSTGKQSKAQLTLADNSVVVVANATDFKVEQFESKKREDGPGTAIFSLLRGGFRTITGLIGKGKNDTYEVRTGVATIGVRGTAYSAVMCKGQCGANFKDGLYAKVDQGIVIVTNPAGSMEVRAGQVAFVSIDGSAPVRVAASPWRDPIFELYYTFDLDLDIRIEQMPPISPCPVSPSDPDC